MLQPGLVGFVCLVCSGTDLEVQPCVAQVLFSDGGYTYLDVRSPLELEEIGKVKGCVNVPMTLTKKVYDPKVNKKVVQREDNPDWLAQVCAWPQPAHLPASVSTHAPGRPV